MENKRDIEKIAYKDVSATDTLSKLFAPDNGPEAAVHATLEEPAETSATATLSDLITTDSIAESPGSDIADDTATRENQGAYQGRSDFLECVFIANAQYRFSKYISKRLKGSWFDTELSHAMGKINRLYITEFVMLAGVAALGLAMAERFSGVTVLLAVLLWIILDAIVVSPLIYLAVVPKPVSAHIKRVEDLTSEEKRVREEELTRNERAERLLRRYKFSGTAEYDEEGNRLDDLRGKIF